MACRAWRIRSSCELEGPRTSRAWPHRSMFPPLSGPRGSEIACLSAGRFAWLAPTRRKQVEQPVRPLSFYVRLGEHERPRPSLPRRLVRCRHSVGQLESSRSVARAHASCTVAAVARTTSCCVWCVVSGGRMTRKAKFPASRGPLRGVSYRRCVWPGGHAVSHGRHYYRLAALGSSPCRLASKSLPAGDPMSPIERGARSVTMARAPRSGYGDPCCAPSPLYTADCSVHTA